ncbi:hypothetical protein [Helicobacter heilmannii]|nr:hypothetical protein [Helicobacter heilmannii]CRF45507.1 hypothetical protein HHE014_04700 [Helicobacter heilmannii]
MRKVFFTLSLALSFLSASNLYERIHDKETIIVATEGNYPPFSDRNA